MKKLLLGTLCLLGLAVSPARAQYYPPPTTPFVRPPLFPYSGFYGNPAARLYGPYGYPGAQMGPGTYGYGTVPAPGIMGTGGQTATTASRSADLTDPNVTGHPTRFFSYSQYYFNQGGGITTTTGTIPGAPPPRVTPVIGTAPPRGKANTKTGS